MSDDHRAANREFFDKWAPRFEGGRMSAWFTHYQGKVIDAFPAVDGGALLDVGCGSGWLVRETKRRLPAWTVTGVDLSPKMVASARAEAERDGVEATFVESDSGDLPFPDASFDVVTCTASFHHYPDPVAVMRGWRRVLKPGGRFLLLESCTSFPPIWLYDRYLRIAEKGHVQYYRTPQLIRFGEEAGFDAVEALWRERGVMKHGKLFSSLALIRGVKHETD